MIWNFLGNAIESDFHQSLFTTKLLESLEEWEADSMRINLSRRKRREAQLLPCCWRIWSGGPRSSGSHYSCLDETSNILFVLNVNFQFPNPKRGPPTGQIQVQCQHLAVEPRREFLSFGVCNRGNLPEFFTLKIQNNVKEFVSQFPIWVLIGRENDAGKTKNKKGTNDYQTTLKWKYPAMED